MRGNELWLSLNEGAFRQILSAVRSCGRAFRTAGVNTGGVFLLVLSE